MTRHATTAVRLSKRICSHVLGRTGLLSLDLAMRSARSVIAVNYHETPSVFAHDLERHLAFYSEHFRCLVEDELEAFLNGDLSLARPGIVLTFDDGLRDHATVAAPLLERFGLRGWFMVPVGFASAPEDLQTSYYRAHIRSLGDSANSADDRRLAMSWHQMKALSTGGHVIGCHGWSHASLGSPTPALIDTEIIRARESLGERLGHPIRTFCWPRGGVRDHSAQAHRAISEVYDLGFTTTSRAIRPRDDRHALPRFNVEAHYAMDVVLFSISRVNELAFARRRMAVTALLRGHGP